jgi:phosphatidylglycerophosphate synthase
MIATNWRLPDAPLRASAVTSKLVGLAALVGLAQIARSGLPLGASYALTASVAFAAMMAVSMGFLQRHHPFERFGPANQITTARAILVALIVGLVGEPHVPAVAVSAAAASLVVTMMDGVDGWLARRHRIASDFGARFDMEIDALLILTLAVLAWQFDKAGPWVLLSGLLRYGFVAAGSIAPWLSAPLPPSRRRQAVCVVQILGLTLVMLPVVAPPLSNAVAASALVALIASFLVDILWLWRRAN